MTLAAFVLALVALPPADSGADPLLLDFQAEWCGPCKAMQPQMEALAKAGYPIKKIDVDQSPDLAKRYKIGPIPAFVIVDADGNELARMVGARPATELASLYRNVQAKLQAASNERRSRGDTTEVGVRGGGHRPLTRGSEEPDESDDGRTEEELRARSDRPSPPKPWETAVRIRIHLSSREVGSGSGTIVYSSADEAIILTCAHIFKLNDRPTPSDPKKFPVRIDVDLFDGRLTESRPHAVHFQETLEGKAIDYDFVNDVGLIRIRPGRKLPASPIVPVVWKPAQGIKMITVGCSEGQDATAWSTKILRPNAALQHVKNGQAVPFNVTECEHAPKQGRSGGGLYTEDGFVAGVCDFADTNANRGLYATPTSIYRILDRNNLTALYRPDQKGSDRLLADNAPAERPRTSARGQSPTDSDRREISLPNPKMMGIPEPKLVSADPDEKPAPKGSRSWQTRPAVPAGMVADPSPEDFDAKHAPAPVDPEEGKPTRPEPPVTRPGGNGKWVKLKKTDI